MGNVVASLCVEYFHHLTKAESNERLHCDIVRGPILARQFLHFFARFNVTKCATKRCQPAALHRSCCECIRRGLIAVRRRVVSRRR